MVVTVGHRRSPSFADNTHERSAVLRAGTRNGASTSLLLTATLLSLGDPVLICPHGALSRRPDIVKKAAPCPRQSQ